MNQRDKEGKHIQDRLKKLFGKKQTGNSKKAEFALTDDVLRDLSKDSPLSLRSRTLAELGDNILNYKLEENAVAKLWYSFRDIFTEDNPKETRDVAFHFLSGIIISQYDRLVNLMRAEIFRFVRQHDVRDDLPQRFRLLQVLTNNGKDLQYFEEEVAPFLLGLMNAMVNCGKEEEFLGLLLNVIKFNAAYLDDIIIMGIVVEINSIICGWKSPEIVVLCLQILDALIAYSNLPSTSLSEVIAALCRTIHIRDTCLSSWNVMKNLLGTDKGHKSIYVMCRMLEDQSLKKEAILLRGAVFYLHMSLWSTHKISKLLCPPNSILPAYSVVLKTKYPGIVYEVTMGVQNLVKNGHSGLMEPVWETIMRILTCVIQQIDEAPDNETMKQVVGPLHHILDFVEKLVDEENFSGDVDRFYDVLQLCAHRRTDASIYKLIDHLTSKVVPFEYHWLNNLHNVLHKYFKHDVRTNVRLKVLENLENIMQLYRRNFEDELVDAIIIPHMSNIHCDPEVMFRANATKLLIDLCLVCDWKKCLEILEILEKLLMQPFDDHSYDYKRGEESDFYDIVCLVGGLTRLFIKKMYRLPSSHAVKVYKMLVKFLEMSYRHPKVFEVCSEPRYMIFECLLKMRADNWYRLGYVQDGKMVYSPYLYITYKSKDKGAIGSSPPASPAFIQMSQCTITYISLNKIFKIFITCLREEKDWKILSLVLQELPRVLQNKNLILSKDGNGEVHLLSEILTAMIFDKNLNLPDSLNTKVNKPDFHTAVLLVLLNIACYHQYMPPAYQRNLIACLMHCIKIMNKSLKNCISALMILALEMKETMMKMLPQVLLSLSHTSATKSSALPILEFLSVLSQLPRVYSNFTGVQYMAIFAITLPYTNPFKYNTYIASLAHYVIATWFLKCRIELRKEFVKYITTGLQTNVLIPFEEEKAALRNEMQRLNELNKDSADRKRSSSLTEQGRPRRRAATVSARAETNNSKRYFQKPSSNVLTFYQELTETCVDLMARYAFQQPRRMKRGYLSDYMLKKGQSMTWIVGRTIVTITTSGCSTNILKNGVCETCWETVTNLDKKDSSNVSRQNSNEKSDNDASMSSPAEENKKNITTSADQSLEQLPTKLQEFIESDDRYSCPCWCMGWAEVHFRRPTGDMKYLVRISPEVLNFDVPLAGLTNTYLPFLSNERKEIQEAIAQSVEEAAAEPERLIAVPGPSNENNEEPEVPGSPVVKQAPSRQSSRESIEEEPEPTLYDDGPSTSRNPVRRSNSSPEMSPSWKNPFLRQKQENEDSPQTQDDEGVKKNKLHSKDMKVSCEAIPEEFAGSGTTPPKTTTDVQASSSTPSTASAAPQHPSLLSCHSYPGSSPPKESPGAQKTSQTVPASPNTPSTSKSQPSFPSRTFSFLKGKSDSVESTSSEKGHEIQKSSSSSIIEKTTSGLNSARDRAVQRKNVGSFDRMPVQDVNQSQKRDRVHTVSVMGGSSSSGSKPPEQAPKGSPQQQQQPRIEKAKSGLSPSLLFIHMYHSAIYGFKGERPMLVSDASPSVQRSLKILDSIPPYGTYTIGIIYIGEGQCNNETEILRNSFGSIRFVGFLQTIGTNIKLKETDPQLTFLGGLEQNGNDGKYAYIWEDDFTRIMFHVATMMPTRDKEKDPKCTNKKKHIGNDSVVIVYNESGEEYNIDTLKGQMNFASIIIEPLDHNSNRITVKFKNELDELIGAVDPLVVSEQNVGVLTRQLALHYDLASQVLKSSKTSAKDPYSSNWLERLRKIKQVREKLLEEKEAEKQSKHREDPVYSARLNNIEDVTEYT